MAQEKSLYYKSLYGDFSDHTNPGDCYLGAKNRNKNTLEFVTLSPCLNLWYHDVLSLFWTFQGDSSERATAEIKLARIPLKRPKMVRTPRQGKKFWCLVLSLFLMP